MPVPIDITGQRYGHLVALRIVGRGSSGREWLCRCDCGNEVVVPQSKLRKGLKYKCNRAGCTVTGNKNDRYTRHKPVEHGGSVYPKNSTNRLYRIYNHMRDRCGVIRGADARHLTEYRDRGITVCQEWQDSYNAFEAWALANGYRDDLSIDRIDNDAGYSPDNCRWATVSQQNANKRHSARRTYAS